MLGGGRSQQIYAQFLAVKGDSTVKRRDEVPQRRHADVLFYSYDKDVGVRALVDLEARSVVEVASMAGRSVPLAFDEIAEAARLALGDQRVAALFGGRIPAFQVATKPATRKDARANRIEGLRTLAASEDDPCFRHRCVILFFRQGNRYVHMNQVVVDLTSRVVMVGGAK